MRGQRSRYDAPTDVRAVLTINIGYRSLIDWTNTPEWTHAYNQPQGKGLMSQRPGTPGSRMDKNYEGTSGIDLHPEFWSGSLSNAPKKSASTPSISIYIIFFVINFLILLFRYHIFHIQEFLF